MKLMTDKNKDKYIDEGQGNVDYQHKNIYDDLKVHKTVKQSDSCFQLNSTNT